MKATAEQIVNEYLRFSGKRSVSDCLHFLERIRKGMSGTKGEDYKNLTYIMSKVRLMYVAAAENRGYIEIEIQETREFFYPSKRRKGGGELGKITDQGTVPGKGRADDYWERRGVKNMFEPENASVRTGAKLPPGFKPDEPDKVMKYFGLRGMEFGNRLSEQDKINYLSGFALALYDLQQLLKFEPKQMSFFGRLSVSFGGRGSGSSGAAHFDAQHYVLNIQRYKRPAKGTSKDRTKLMLESGGIGALAHEFAHALDHYCGTYVEKAGTGWLSGGRSTHTASDIGLMKKVSLEGHVERLLNKIIWSKDGRDYSAYYKRLKNLVKAQEGEGEYWLRRDIIFARAFEVYVHLKMKRKGWKNIFLTEYKFDTRTYFTDKEAEKLERDFDTLISAMRIKINKGRAKE